MKQFIHLKSTIIPWVTGPIRYSMLARAFFLTAVLFACLALSQAARAANPAPGTPATSASGGAIDGAQNFSNTALLRPAPKIITFDAPGSGTGPGQGTFAGNIIPGDAIAGRYVDASDVAHGFLRAPDGTFTTFDAPNAGTGPGEGTFVFTGFCLNPAGAIAGTSLDASDVYHGILRAPDGTINTFDVPGAGTGPFQGTLPLGINQTGTIEGDYIDSSDVNHGFVRTSDGAITTFDVPGAGTGPFQATSPQVNNAPGATPGKTGDASD